MPKLTSAEKSAHEIELGLRKLKCLSTMPSFISGFLSRMDDLRSNEAIEIIKSDPALSCKILSLLSDNGISFSSLDFSMKKAVEHLSVQELVEAVFSSNISWENGSRPIKQKDMTVYSIAVACCAEKLAGEVSPQMNPELAYFSGLLHNIGNLAIFEAMPKSFDILVKEASRKNSSLAPVQKKHLGMDYTLIGKKLCRQWHLPKQIEMAIWLHQSNPATFSKQLSEAKLAQVVQVASCIARKYKIGTSCDFRQESDCMKTASDLGISEQALTRIAENLKTEVKKKMAITGLDVLNNIERYCRDVHSTAVNLAKKNSMITAEHKKFAAASSHLNFAEDFLCSIPQDALPLDIAEELAARLQRFYQTGQVCLYIVNPADQKTLDAVIIDSSGQSNIIPVKAERFPVPEQLTDNFDILDAEGICDWLFGQIETEFKYENTKIAPILCHGKAIGAIIFELNFPVDLDELKKQFEGAASIAGAVLGLSFTSEEQQRLAEIFLQIPETKRAETAEIKESDTENKLEEQTSQNKKTGTNSETTKIFAEMAAGAAHELNNPLLIASGRAQLLSEKENDEESKQALDKIRDNMAEISGIIDDLMRYAEPRKPRKEKVPVRQLIDEAVQFTSRKKKSEILGFDVNIPSDCADVEVDSVQTVTSISNIFTNALESYENQKGPITVRAEMTDNNLVKLLIEDQGCGMDEETLEKAKYPFFSNKPAGRQRGMGLAQAHRLITMNNGKMEIESQFDKGTTVNIYLPTAL